MPILITNRNNSVVTTDNMLNEIYRDSLRYAGLDTQENLDPNQGFNLSGVKGRTILPNQFHWPNINFIKRLFRKKYILFRVGNYETMNLIGHPWTFKWLKNIEIDQIPNNYFVIPVYEYYSMASNYLTENGLIAIPCKSDSNFYYIYFGLFRYSSEETDRNITDQNGNEIELLGPGGGGPGNNSGLRIPTQ